MSLAAQDPIDTIFSYADRILWLALGLAMAYNLPDVAGAMIEIIINVFLPLVEMMIEEPRLVLLIPVVVSFADILSPQ